MTAITVPARILDTLRATLLGELGGAAALIANASVQRENEKHPEYFQQPLERFHATGRLLDTIGWWTTDEAAHAAVIDLDRHGPLLRHVLRERLDADRGHISDTATGEAERERTESQMRDLEQLLASCGPEAPTPGRHHRDRGLAERTALLVLLGHGNGEEWRQDRLRGV
jgi:hypothetical protein